MKNITIKEDGDNVVLFVNTKQDFGPSKSGKTKIIASSEGNMNVTLKDGRTITVGLNVYKK